MKIKTVGLSIIIMCQFACYSMWPCNAECNRVIDVFGEKYIKHDVNADGVFDVRDLVRIKSRIAGNKRTINLMAADANQDGIINSLDLGIIRKLLLEDE